MCICTPSGKYDLKNVFIEWKNFARKKTPETIAVPSFFIQQTFLIKNCPDLKTAIYLVSSTSTNTWT